MIFRRLAMALTAAWVCLMAVGCGGDDVTLQGAGATFPAPLYKRWFLEYYKRHPEVRVNYQPIGSGAGIRQFTEGLVDFGASDAFMKPDEIKKAQEAGREVLQLPMTAGSIVLCYNLPGGAPTGGLRLTRRAYVDIFLGKILSWDDPAIAKANPGVALPAERITVVRRADSSGTTNAFTSHLNAIDPAWKKDKGGPGAGKSIVWPGENVIAGKGNEGVAALIDQTPGAIGYLEYGYADLAHLPMALVENKKGAFIQPSPESGQRAVGEAKITPDLHLKVEDPAGADAYPIVTYTWMLCRKKYDDPRAAAAIKDVLRFGLGEGQRISGELGYIPLPEPVAKKVLEAVETIKP
jgi:phosphate transport system substrate-binding protein